MMKKIVLGAMLFSSLLLADDSISAKAELGYSKTSGNTDTEALNLDSKAKKVWDEHSVGAEVDARYSKSNGKEDASRFGAELNYGHAYDADLTIGYLAGYKRDKFSGYKYQIYTGPYAEYKAYKSDLQNLALELAALYAKDKLEDGRDESYASARVRAIYDYQIMENLKFAEDLSYRTSLKEGKHYFVTSKTSLVNKITDIFSAGITYRVDYAYIVPEGNKRTDRAFLVNLIAIYN